MNGADTAGLPIWPPGVLMSGEDIPLGALREMARNSKVRGAAALVQSTIKACHALAFRPDTCGLGIGALACCEEINVLELELAPETVATQVTRLRHLFHAQIQRPLLLLCRQGASFSLSLTPLEGGTLRQEAPLHVAAATEQLAWPQFMTDLGCPPGIASLTRLYERWQLAFHAWLLHLSLQPLRKLAVPYALQASVDEARALRQAVQPLRDRLVQLLRARKERVPLARQLEHSRELENTRQALSELLTAAYTHERHALTFPR